MPEAMSIDRLIETLVAIREARKGDGSPKVYMTQDDEDLEARPVVTPVMVGRDLILYADKLF